MSLEFYFKNSFCSLFIKKITPEILDNNLLTINSLKSEIKKYKITSHYVLSDLNPSLEFILKHKKTVPDFCLLKGKDSDPLGCFDFIVKPFDLSFLPLEDIKISNLFLQYASDRIPLISEKVFEQFKEAFVTEDDTFALRSSILTKKCINLIGNEVQSPIIEHFLGKNLDINSEGLYSKIPGYLFYHQGKLHVLSPFSDEDEDSLKGFFICKNIPQTHKRINYLKQYLEKLEIDPQLINENFSKELFKLNSLQSSSFVQLAKSKTPLSIEEHVKLNIHLNIKKPLKLKNEIFNPLISKNLKSKGEIIFEIKRDYSSCFGKTIKGETIKPEYPDFNSIIGEAVDNNDGYGISEGFGFYYLDNGILRFDPFLIISKDSMSASIFLFSLDMDPRFSSLNDILKILNGHQISAGISNEKIEDFLKERRLQNNTLISFEIAKGKTPIAKSQSEFSFFKHFLGEYTPVENEKGQIQWIESQTKKHFEAATILGNFIKGSEQSHGFDIFSKLLPAPEAQEENLPLDDNSIAIEGSNLRSLVPGVLTNINGLWSIVEFFEIIGDVNISTGHIECQGEVKITGNLKQSMEVKALGDIFIGETIEFGKVDCGGNLTVGMGIQGNESSKLKVAGDLRTSFIHNSQVFIGQDAYVSKEILNSEIEILGVAYFEKPGFKFCGGSLTVYSDCNLSSLGSPGLIKTLMILEADKNLINDFDATFPISIFIGEIFPGVEFRYFDFSKTVEEHLKNVQLTFNLEKSQFELLEGSRSR